MLRNKTTASGAILGSSNENGLCHVVSLSLDVEHEVEWLFEGWLREINQSNVTLEATEIYLPHQWQTPERFP